MASQSSTAPQTVASDTWQTSQNSAATIAARFLGNGVASPDQHTEHLLADTYDRIELNDVPTSTSPPTFFIVEKFFAPQTYTLYMINNNAGKQINALIKRANSWPMWCSDFVLGNRLALFTINSSVIDPHRAFVEAAVPAQVQIGIPAEELVSQRYILDKLSRGNTADAAADDTLDDVLIPQKGRVFVLGREPRHHIRALFRAVLSLLPFAAGLIARNVYLATAEVWVAVVGGGIGFVAVVLML